MFLWFKSYLILFSSSHKFLQLQKEIFLSTKHELIRLSSDNLGSLSDKKLSKLVWLGRLIDEKGVSPTKGRGGRIASVVVDMIHVR